MANKNHQNSRRNFLKGAILNSAALSAIPVTALTAERNNTEYGNVVIRPISGLPLTIYLSNGIDDQKKNYLKSLSDQITLIDRLDGSELNGILQDIDVWFGYLSKEQFQSASNLKWIQCPSAGVEPFMFPELIQSQVLLTNAKGCYGPAIGEHTIGLLFSLTRQLANQTRNMASGKWDRPAGMVEMKGKTIGVVGFGGIGSQVARRARALDMKVIAVDIVPKYKEQIGDTCDEIRLVQDGGLEWLMRNSDVVVSAAPHTRISEGMFNKEKFELMKQGSYFINVSRGKLVKTHDLVYVLKSGHIAGAGLDVTDPEPLPSDHELWKLPNVVITAHVAAQSEFSFGRMQQVFVDNVDRFIKGLPLQNLVDKEAGF